MALIYSSGGVTRRLEPSSFENEAALQAYIYRSPEAIPLEELGDGTRLHILGREFPTRSGPIDALGTDQFGTTYIIETKLYKNADKRLVLAQVLDYGASLWAHPPELDDILRELDADATRRQVEPILPRLARFLDSTEQAATEHLANVRENFGAGEFTVVVLMDRLEARLRDLIKFMNGASRFRVLAVELDYYRHDETEIVVPRLFGSEGRETETRGSGRRRKWNEQLFFQDLEARVSEQEATAIRQFFEFAKGSAPIKWGNGAVSGSFSPQFLPGASITPLSVFSDGAAQLKMSWFGDAPEVALYRARLLAALRPLELRIDSKGDGYWSAEEWTPKVRALISAFATSNGTSM